MQEKIETAGLLKKYLSSPSPLSPMVIGASPLHDGERRSIEKVSLKEGFSTAPQRPFYEKKGKEHIYTPLIDVAVALKK